MPDSSITVRWKEDQIATLLQLIVSNPIYREALFGRGVVKHHKKWEICAELCIEIFQDCHDWVAWALREGKIRRSKRHGGWKPSGHWEGGSYNPVSTKIEGLKHWYNGIKDGESGYDPRWKSIDDVPPKKMKLIDNRPYYFLLRDLMLPNGRFVETSSSPADLPSIPDAALVRPSTQHVADPLSEADTKLATIRPKSASATPRKRRRMTTDSSDEKSQSSNPKKDAGTTHDTSDTQDRSSIHALPPQDDSILFSPSPTPCSELQTPGSTSSARLCSVRPSTSPPRCTSSLSLSLSPQVDEPCQPPARPYQSVQPDFVRYGRSTKSKAEKQELTYNFLRSSVLDPSGRLPKPVSKAPEDSPATAKRSFQIVPSAIPTPVESDKENNTEVKQASPITQPMKWTLPTQPIDWRRCRTSRLEDLFDAWDSPVQPNPGPDPSSSLSHQPF